MIHDREELRDAYIDLRLWNTLANITPPGKKQIVELKIMQVKRDIRNYNMRDTMEYPHWYIDDGFDGGTEIVVLPGNYTRKQVEDYYETYMHRECTPSMYDCTGQVFSVWHKAFETGLGWKIYHRIAMDV